MAKRLRGRKGGQAAGPPVTSEHQVNCSSGQRQLQRATTNREPSFALLGPCCGVGDAGSVSGQDGSALLDTQSGPPRPCRIVPQGAAALGPRSPEAMGSVLGGAQSDGMDPGSEVRL